MYFFKNRFNEISLIKSIIKHNVTAINVIINAISVHKLAVK